MCSSDLGAWKTEREFGERAQSLRRKLKAQALLVTRGADGMTLFERGRRLHVPAQAREVSDVSGAGDTVIATLAVIVHSLAMLIVTGVTALLVYQGVNMGMLRRGRVDLDLVWSASLIGIGLWMLFA